MEHRHDQRVELPLKVWVNFGDMPTLVTTTRNISKSGLCLGFTHAELKVSYLINVVFEDRTSKSHWQGRALVIHTSPEGTGVLLSKDLPYSLYGTNAAIYARQTMERQLVIE